MLERKDPFQANILDRWLHLIHTEYAECLLPVCKRVAEEWGILQAKKSLSVIDGLLAATSRVHHLTLATRNIEDFRGIDLQIVNPFL